MEAARLLRAEPDDIEIVLVGAPDRESPSGVPEEDLRAWDDEGLITWLGHQDDVKSVLTGCHLALLPTYYKEGFPKSLLEAAACGLPIVATDVTGCRDICLDGVNGIMIAPRDPAAIAAALVRLADDAGLRSRYGEESRRLVVDRFSERIVVENHMDLYREMQE